MSDKNRTILKGVLIVLGIVCVCCLSFFAGTSKEKTNTDTNVEAAAMVARAQEESSSVSDEDKKELNAISIDQYLDYYAGSEDTLILIARPTCSYCQIAEPILQKLSKDYDFTINYLNTDDLDEDAQGKFIGSDDYFSEGYGTPMLLVVSNGKIVDMVDGLADTAGYTDFLTGHGYIK